MSTLMIRRFLPCVLDCDLKASGQVTAKMLEYTTDFSMKWLAVCNMHPFKLKFGKEDSANLCEGKDEKKNTLLLCGSFFVVFDVCRMYDFVFEVFEFDVILRTEATV